MKILFYGDSITDMARLRENPQVPYSLGVGYPNLIAAELQYTDPEGYEVLNLGISGNRIVDLYARIKADVWNHQPDVLSILIGVNDVWHELGSQNGVDIERWEKVYRMLIEDTKKKLPNLKIIILEPFVLEGTATTFEGRYERFLEVKEYAKVAKKIAEDYGACFVSLQNLFDEVAAKHGGAYYLYDGVHPTAAGSKLIANEWLKVFKEEIKK